MNTRWGKFGLAGLIFLLDRLSKLWIEKNLTVWDTVTVIPGVFNIVHTQNKGAAFGFLSDSQSPWRFLVLIGLSAAVMAFLAVQLWRAQDALYPGGNLSSAALAMILGGASGNLFDRIWRGSVTDFLQVFIGTYEWPSFNVADSAISCGAVLLILTLWNKPRAAVTS